MSKYIESTNDIDFSECSLQALEVSIREEAYPIIERNFEKLVYYWIMCRYLKEFALGDDIMGIYEWFMNEMLDPTMGSGSCGEACLNLNRKFIGIEMDERWYDYALKRLEHS